MMPKKHVSLDIKLHEANEIPLSAIKYVYG